MADFAGSAMSGFQTGQAIGAGQSSLGMFIKDITDRKKQMDLLQQTQNIKTQGDIQVERAKQQATLEYDPIFGTHGMNAQTPQPGGPQPAADTTGGAPAQPPPTGATPAINKIMAFGQNTPPGSSYTRGGLRIELNPPGTAEKASIIGNAGRVRDRVSELEGYIRQRPTGEGARYASQIASQIPAWVTGFPGVQGAVKGLGMDVNLGLAQKIQNARKDLTMILSFSNGGKQLTETEKKTITDLLDPTGLDTPLIVENLHKFENTMSKMEDYVTHGSYASPREAALAAVRDSGIDLPTQKVGPGTSPGGQSSEDFIRQMEAKGFKYRGTR